MKFNERVHAFLAAEYYEKLTELDPLRGEAAYIHAIRYYGHQRGRRMAMRAIADGRELTHEVFQEYNELIATSGDGVVPADGELISLSPDYELHITNCPWHDQFCEMGARKAGSVYCSLIDEATCGGFNPKLVFRAEGSLNDSPYCTHIVEKTYYKAFPDAPQKKEYAHTFDYHCAHLYFSCREALISTLGETGERAAEEVRKAFTEKYGMEMTERLLSFENCNFNTLS